MSANFKCIHIGKMIQQRMKECGVGVERAAKFLKVKEEEVEKVYDRKSVDSSQLLSWSKLLEYDFFRIYSQHLILYAPQDKTSLSKKNQKRYYPASRKISILTK